MNDQHIIPDEELIKKVCLIRNQTGFGANKISSFIEDISESSIKRIFDCINKNDIQNVISIIGSQ